MPAALQMLERANVDRDSAVFHRGHGPRIAATKKSAAQVYPRQHRGKKPGQRHNIFGAVIQKGRTLCIGKGAATDGQRPH